MTLSDILEQQAQFTKNSGFKVKISTIFSWVAIDHIESDDDDDEEVFLQGDDADMFISELDDLYEETGDLDKDTIALALAKDYIECLGC